MYGIYSTNFGQNIFAGSTVNGLLSTAQTTTLAVWGIHSEFGSVLVISNTISNQSSAAANMAATGFTSGIYHNTTTIPGTIISGNTISNPGSTSTSTSAISVHGIYLNAPNTGT